MTQRNNAGTGCVIGLVVLVIGIGWIGSAVDEWREPESFPMPNLVGLSVSEAEDALSALYDEDWEYEDRPDVVATDLSPLEDTYRTAVGSWIVEQTIPAAGESIRRGAETKVFLWSLSEEEHAWFDANPVMPALPADSDPSELVRSDGSLHAVEDLVEFRYVAGETDGGEIWYGPEMDTVPLADGDPSIEPQAERDARMALEWAENLSQDLTVASVPTAGEPLRRGQILTVTVRVKPDEPPSEVTGVDGGEGGSVGGGVGAGVGGDVDVDIDKPRFCSHTRWC